MKGMQPLQSGSTGSKSTGKGGCGAGTTSPTAKGHPAPKSIGANNSGGKVSHSGTTVSSLKAGGASMGSTRRG